MPGLPQQVAVRLPARAQAAVGEEHRLAGIAAAVTGLHRGVGGGLKHRFQPVGGGHLQVPEVIALGALRRPQGAPPRPGHARGQHLLQAHPRLRQAV
jgi:hypothetical protein